MTKLMVYIFVTPFVVLAMDSININGIFKKNKNYNFQANLFYFMLGMSLIYLITSLIYDFILLAQN